MDITNASGEDVKFRVKDASTLDGLSNSAFEDLAERLAIGFLVPACQAVDHEARWKSVNRAAGAIAGYVFSFGPEMVNRLRLAQNLTEASLNLCGSAWPTDARETRIFSVVAGDKGLSKRVAECLLALGVES